MKIGNLNDHCGECAIIDYCTDPFETPKICSCRELENVDEDDYIRIAESLNQQDILDMCSIIEQEDYGYDDVYREAIKRLVIERWVMQHPRVVRFF